MKINKKAIILIFVSVCFVGIILTIAISSNVNALFLIAEGLEKPSKAYYSVIQRIYRLSANKKTGDEIWSYVESNKNANLIDLYIKVLAITNAEIASGNLIKLYSLCQQNAERRSTVSIIIDSMGLLGNDDFIPFLETLLRDYDKLKVQATKYAIARALYLITGNKYAYDRNPQETTKLQVTKELIEARDLILVSKGRYRSIQEMLVLDKLYRPPGW